jgi:tetratricopeptide (TPR) repeat protein
MRKLFLTVVLSASIGCVFAQKLEDVQEKISKGKYDEAKEKIDKVLADPKNATNASAWYYKGKIYAEMARTDTAGKLGYDAGKEAFEAFKKYQELDKKNIMMTLDQNVGLFQLYDMYYNQGIKMYNAKDYDRAFDRMKNAMSLEEYIAKRSYTYNGFSFPALDTQLINLTASSAFLAKREDDAIPYFEKTGRCPFERQGIQRDLRCAGGILFKKEQPAKSGQVPWNGKGIVS